jgi:hypothetical protein
MWSWIKRWSAPDSRKAVWKDQLEAIGWWNVSHITRLLPLATTYYLVQCCCEISLPLISITRLLFPATKLTRLTNLRSGLFYFTKLSYSWLWRLRTIQQDTWWIEAAHQEGIYRLKSDVHKPGAPTEQAWQRSQWKDRKQYEEDTRMKEQYSKTSIFERITNTVHLVTTENSIQPPTTTNFRHKSRLPKKTIEDPLSKFLTIEKTQKDARGLQDTYPQKSFSVFWTNKIRDAPTFIPNSKRFGGYT